MEKDCQQRVLVVSSSLLCNFLARTGPMDTTLKRKKCVISLGQLTDKNIKQLKVLNSVVFPVHYRDSFYDALLRKTELSQLGMNRPPFVLTVKLSTMTSWLVL